MDDYMTEAGADLEEAEEERLWEEMGKDENKGEPHRRELQRRQRPSSPSIQWRRVIRSR